MSDRYTASTPPSSSRSGAVSSSSTGNSRHLKRLSLSGSAFSPVASPVESAGTTTTGGASPLSSRTARPASTLGGGSPAAGGAGGALADRTNSPSLLRRSTSYRAASAASPASSEPSSTATVGATPEHPTQATSTDRSLPTPTRSGSAARVRRGTSISYTGGSTPTRLSLDGGGALREEPPSRASLDNPATRTSSALGLADVPETENTLVVPQIESRAHTSPALSTQPSPALSATSGSTASAATSNAAAPTPSTLLEQNADLLSIIAKKERKCLDLREELKRNEADLAALKNKWQAIVARSLQAQAYQPYVPFQHRSSPSIATIASTASPNTSPTPQPALLPHATHSLDLSLLTSTFEPADYNLDGITPGHIHGDASPMEIPESVKAAGSWLGGALGRVLEAAVGMPPPLEEGEDDDAGDEYEQPPRRPDVTGLGIVDEEQEEEEDDDPERRSFGDATTTNGVSPSPLSSHTDATTSEAPKPNHLPSPRNSHTALSPPPPSSRATRAARSPPPPSSSSTASASSSSYGLSLPGTSPTHSRTRSAFSGLLSDKLSSRWAALSSSEMIQSSKRATLGLVDTFEQGLAHALGPLEPPPLPPFEQQQHQQQRRRADEADRTRTEEEQQQQQRTAQARRLPMPGATPGQGLASLFAAASSTSPRPADHFAD